MSLKRTVLIVDDEDDVLDSLAASLSVLNCEILTVDNVNSAYEIIIDKFIDLVVTDIRMPGGTGFDLLRKIKQLPPDDRPVAIVISGTDDFTKEKQKEFNVTKYLQKPFNLDYFAAKIKEELDKL